MKTESPQPTDDLAPSVLSGRTALVYLYIASKRGKSAGVREVQRAMHLSSPSSALHHLSKLEASGILSKREGGDYVLKRKIKSVILNDFVFIGTFLIPRPLIYAVSTTFLSLIFSLLLVSYLSSLIALLALLPNLASAAIFWYQTMLLMRFKNTFR